MIKLEILSKDPSDIELASRYWAMGEDGNFIEPINRIIPCGKISSPSQLIKYINQISRVEDLDRACQTCGKNTEIRSRAEARSKYKMHNTTCTECMKIKAIEQQQIKKSEDEQLKLRIAQLEENNSKKKIRYDSIPDEIILLLVALENSINPRLIESTFTINDCRNLSPYDCDKFLKKVFNSGAIVDLPSKATPSTYFLKEGEIWFYSDKLVYALVPDVEIGKSQESFEVIRNRSFSDGRSIHQLWLDYSTSDCIAYLLDQSNIHGLEISSEAESEIRSILRTALNNFSVAELWSCLWKISKDAASLSAREYYNKKKAAATIPGKIKRNLEQAIKGDVILKAWDRPKHQQAGTLGDVFYEFFGIDENTSGKTASNIFSELNCDFNDHSIHTETEQSYQNLVQQSLEDGIVAKVMSFFAKRVASGDDEVSALNATIEAYLEIKISHQDR